MWRPPSCTSPTWVSTTSGFAGWQRAAWMTNHLIDEVLGYVTTLTVEGASCGASTESGVNTPVRSLANARYASRWMGTVSGKISVWPIWWHSQG